MQLNKFISFNLLPASWGLKGKTRRIAEAEYYYTGYKLEQALAEIEYENDKDKLDLAIVNINIKYGFIMEYDAAIKIAELTHKISKSTDNKLLELTKLDIELKYGNISQQEYDRKYSDLSEKPFIAMPKISWDPADPSKTYFELDYNEYFVPYLEKHGYTGNEEMIINRWLNDVCNSILDEMEPQDPEFVRTIKSVRRPDGRVEHL
jgi:hypothetical protein